jgi:uncharacterized protein
MRTMVLALSLWLAPSSWVLADHHPAADRRSVSVGGQGEISVKPDRARLSLAVDRFASEPQPAEAEANKVVRAYLAELKKLGIEDKHVSTAGVSLQPEYVWDEKLRQNRITGYRARRDVQVLADKLDRVGDLILSATKVGMNHVMPPVLESSRAKELGREALAAAADDARARAELLARILGAKLGPVRSITASEGGFQPPPMPKVMAMRMDAAAESGNAQMGFEAGEIKVTAAVQAEFDLLAP